MPRVALACIVAGSILAAVSMPARAADGLQAAYWWSAQPGGLPAPPHVPPGGLYISSNPLGPQAVAAISFVLADSDAAPQLILRIRQLQEVDALAVAAYPAIGAWQPGDAQAWSARPTYDAKASPVKGAVAADRTSVTFDLASATGGQRVNLVLVPDIGTGGASPSFDVAFEQPAPGDVRVTAVEPPAPAADAPALPPFPVAFEPPGPIDVSPAPGLALIEPAAPSLPVGRSQDTPSFAPPTATAQPIGRARSVRDNVILGVLLMNALLFIGWQARGRRPALGRSRITIYDLPPGGAASSESA
jgi:hypothetical protein